MGRAPAVARIAPAHSGRIRGVASTPAPRIPSGLSVAEVRVFVANQIARLARLAYLRIHPHSQDGHSEVTAAAPRSMPQWAPET